jgi:hypothetical protein
VNFDDLRREVERTFDEDPPSREQMREWIQEAYREMWVRLSPFEQERVILQILENWWRLPTVDGSDAL